MEITRTEAVVVERHLETGSIFIVGGRMVLVDLTQVANFSARSSDSSVGVKREREEEDEKEEKEEKEEDEEEVDEKKDDQGGGGGIKIPSCSSATPVEKEVEDAKECLICAIDDISAAKMRTMDCCGASLCSSCKSTCRSESEFRALRQLALRYEHKFEDAVLCAAVLDPTSPFRGAVAYVPDLVTRFARGLSNCGCTNTSCIFGDVDGMFKQHASELQLYLFHALNPERLDDKLKPMSKCAFCNQNPEEVVRTRTSASHHPPLTRRRIVDEN